MADGSPTTQEKDNYAKVYITTNQSTKFVVTFELTWNIDRCKKEVQDVHSQICPEMGQFICQSFEMEDPQMKDRFLWGGGTTVKDLVQEGRGIGFVELRPLTKKRKCPTRKKPLSGKEEKKEEETKVEESGDGRVEEGTVRRSGEEEGGRDAEREDDGGEERTGREESGESEEGARKEESSSEDKNEETDEDESEEEGEGEGKGEGKGKEDGKGDSKLIVLVPNVNTLQRGSPQGGPRVKVNGIPKEKTKKREESKTESDEIGFLESTPANKKKVPVSVSVGNFRSSPKKQKVESKTSKGKRA